jgi:hypothetical protein
LGLAILAGVGFTIALLIGELAFGAGSARDAHVKIAVRCWRLLFCACVTAPTAAFSWPRSPPGTTKAIPRRLGVGVPGSLVGVVADG